MVGNIYICFCLRVLSGAMANFDEWGHPRSGPIPPLYIWIYLNMDV